MQSKTSFSNFTLFRRCLSRYWPLWAAIFGLMTFLGPVSLGNTLEYLKSQHLPAAQMLEASAANVYDFLSLMPIYTVVAGLLAAVASFDFLFSNRLTGLMASIPVKRRGVFVQHYLAGAVMLLSSLAVTALAILAVQAVHHAVTFPAVAEVFAVSALECLIFYSIAVFCCTLTGHFLVAIALYALVNLAGAILWLLLNWFVGTYVFGLTCLPGGEWLFWFSPFIELMNSRGITVDGFNGWTPVWIYTAVAAVLTVCSCVLYDRRDMERAQDTVAFPKLRPVLKYIVTFFAALGLPLVMATAAELSNAQFSLPVHLLLTIVSVIIGYFISEMIIQKSIHVFQKRHWIGIGAAALVCCLVVCGLRLDWLGISHRIPAPEKVQAVSMQAGENFYADSEESIREVERLHQLLLDAWDSGELREPEVYSDEVSYLELNYILKNGETEQRHYEFLYDDTPGSFVQSIESALNSEPLRSENILINPPIPVTAEHIAGADIGYPTGDGEYGDWQLTAADAVDLYENGIRPDCMSDAFGHVGLTYAFDPEDQPYDVSIQITLYEKSTEPTWGSWYLCYNITEDTVNTNAWLEAHGIQPTQSFTPGA